MAIFGYIETEEIVQENDRTRINCVKSFTSKDQAQISLVEIEPEAGNGFITVGTYGVGVTPNAKEWFLDWQYASLGAKVVTLRITAGTTVTATKTITVVTEVADMLWSTDDDLVAHEYDVLKYVAPGRNSFKNIHRKSQKAILEWLDAIRIHRNDGTRLEKADILVTTDVKELSIYWTLYFIYFNFITKPDDIYSMKAKDYSAKVEEVKNRGRIQVDKNQNQTLDASDKQDLKSFRMVRQ